MTGQPNKSRSAAERFLIRLHRHGIEYLFVNAGTDFAPVIEGHAAAGGQGMPRVIAVPHENVAVSMASGYALVSGRPQGVMVHVNVGLANSLCGIMNASRAHIPMVIASGRTPWLEEGRPGARNRFIHWAQEMRDQGAIVREHVKWDYELRDVEQVDDVIDRAVAIATSDPQGPVYLSMPREVLAEESDRPERPFRRPNADASPAPAPRALQQAAERLLSAERPLIIASGVGRTAAETDALAALASLHAIPVVTPQARYVVLPYDHEAHAGFEPGPLLAKADVVLVVNSDVPWIPGLETPSSDAWIAHLGPDPLFSSYPVRSFPADCNLAGGVETGLRALLEAMKGSSVPASRKNRMAEAHRKWRRRVSASLERAEGEAVNKSLSRERASTIFADAVGREAIILNELGGRLPLLDRQKPGTFFGSSPAGGLGWCLGAALGAKLAAPDARVVAAIGDGSYMLGNPTPAHYVSRAYDIPVLFVMFDNGGWAAVDRSTRTMFPEGAAVKGKSGAFSRFLKPLPDYGMVAAASGAHTETCHDEPSLTAALSRALAVVEDENRQALVRIFCED